MQINELGLCEIDGFLTDNHRLGARGFDRSMLDAWARDAEFSMSEGNPPTIEIQARDSVHGVTQTYTISDAGIGED